jgi:hypothetical protein
MQLKTATGHCLGSLERPLARARLPSRALPDRRAQPLPDLPPLSRVRGYTARVPDIPAYGEGETEEGAIADLREALHGYIETFGLDDALSRVSSPAVRTIDWDLAEIARG